MRIDGEIDAGEIDAGEYMQRKEKLTEKKQRFEQLIAGNNHRFDT
jgi:hypothetical protein